MIDFRGYEWVFWEGVKVTLLVGLATIPVALLLGLLGAWGKLSHNPLARLIAGTYTTVVRGIPELVLILLVYFGLTLALQDLVGWLEGGRSSVDIPPFPAGVITLGLIYGAFATEVFRGAFLAVDRGQIEAAYSFGMHRRLALRRIILPQMWRFALPGLGNLWLVLIKATSLMSIIQLPELMRMTDVAARAVRLPFTFYFGASLIYLTITIISIVVLQRAERWANRGVRRA
ncbi:MAG TPA: ABC transporter permease subunit [Kiloniellales bacterium]|nr:ABC transporter permease subunit [Kiloniellales bacterium]